MKVILLQDVKGKGKKGQMIEVSDGYARNYILPRKLAVEATADNVNTMRMTDKAQQEKRQKEREEAFAISKRMADLTVIVRAKGGGAGRLFGSVTTQEIADSLKKQTVIELDKRKIVLDEQIKTVGEYKVKCKLGYEINAELKIKVEEA
jgi:large subunit ribosomal protein L9